MIRRDQIHLSLARLYARCSLYVVLATIPNSILPGPSKRLYVYLPEPSVFCVAPGIFASAEIRRFRRDRFYMHSLFLLRNISITSKAR